jgi:hypothetical protein
MASVTNIDAAKAASLRPDDYDYLIDITLKLLAPFVTNPLKDLKVA